MNQIKRTIITLFVLCIAFISFSGEVSAETTSECGPINIYECLSDGTKADYNLDTVPDKFAEELNWKDKVNEWIPALGKLDEFVGKLNPFSHIPPMLNFFANIAFKMNMINTKIILTMMDFAFDFEIVNVLIDKSASKIRTVSGISTDFSISGGIFGSFLQVIVLTTAVYAMFMFIFKRSILGSFESIFKTLIVITLAMLMFANYSSFLKSANKITTDASEMILGADLGTKKSDENKSDGKSVDLDKDTIRGNMKSNIWHMFVDRPYLYLMFGETSFEKAGIKDRFEAVVKHGTGTEARMQALTKEANQPGDDGYANTSILHSNVEHRLAFTPVYLSLNSLVTIPIMILLISLIIFQFWFLIMALFAPFALIVAAIPGQFNVLKRYGIELAYPLLLKLGVSFMLLMLFFVSDIIFTIDKTISENPVVKTLFYADPLAMYIIMGILNLLLFGMFFILRKRLQDILTSGSQAVKDFKENQGNPFSQAFKSGVQTTAMVSGAVIGGIATGGTGAVVGANIGRTVGGVATGEAGGQEIANTAIQTQRAHDFAKLANQNDEKKANEESRIEQQGQQAQQDKQKKSENIDSARDTPIQNINSSDVSNIFDNMSEDEQETIREAGRQYEEMENLKQKPISAMNDDEYAKLQSQEPIQSGSDEGSDIESKPLEEMSFNEMSTEDQYKTLKENGTFGSSASSSSSDNRTPINVDDIKTEALKASPITDFNRREITEISDRLPEEQRESFINNMNSASLDDMKGKTVEDFTVPLEENDTNRHQEDNYDDSPYHNNDDARLD